MGENTSLNEELIKHITNNAFDAGVRQLAHEAKTLIKECSNRNYSSTETLEKIIEYLDMRSNG